jgi:signal transduction histidine kinase
VGVYSGASYARRRWVALVAVVGFAGFLAREWWEVGHILANDVLSAAEAAAVVTGVGLFVATRRALTASWRDRAERAEAERLLSEERTRSAERTRIAREMHDVVAHKVSLIALHAGALELTADAGPDRVRDEAGLIRVTAREALQELRQVLGVLRADPALPAPDHADPAGPGEAFADVTTLVEAAVRAGQPVELDDRAGALPPATARVVYRIVQEGLTNARKHAPGAAATVVVDRVDNGQVSVTVDNAAPTRPPLDLPGSGAGLVGLAERVRLAGGRLAAGPGPAGGWRLQAAVPPAEPAVERAVKPARAGSTVEDS